MDNLKSVVDGIGKLIDQQEAAYKELVKRTGDGKKVAPAEAKGILDAAGKSVAELTTQVALYKRRVELKGQIAEATKAETEVPAIKDRIKKFDDELAIAQAKHADAVRPLNFEIQQLQQKVLIAR